MECPLSDGPAAPAFKETLATASYARRKVAVKALFRYPRTHESGGSKSYGLWHIVVPRSKRQRDGTSNSLSESGSKQSSHRESGSHSCRMGMDGDHPVDPRRRYREIEYLKSFYAVPREISRMWASAQSIFAAASLAAVQSEPFVWPGSARDSNPARIPRSIFAADSRWRFEWAPIRK